MSKIKNAKVKLINDLKDFVDKIYLNCIEKGTYVCNKETIKNSPYDYSEYANNQLPDLLIYEEGKNKTFPFCVIKLIDGNDLNTQKVIDEYTNLSEYCACIGSVLPTFATYYVCCFNQLDKQKIVESFGQNININAVMTGKELCDMLGKDYDEIINNKKDGTVNNLNYFIDELLKGLQVAKIEIKESKPTKEQLRKIDEYYKKQRKDHLKQKEEYNKQSKKTIYAIVKDYTKDEEAFQDMITESSNHGDRFPPISKEYIGFYENADDASAVIKKIEKLWKKRNKEDADMYCPEDFHIINPKAYEIIAIDLFLKKSKK